MVLENAFCSVRTCCRKLVLSTGSLNVILITPTLTSISNEMSCGLPVSDIKSRGYSI